MEKLLKELVNAGIAVFRSGEKSLKSSIDEIEKVYKELIAKGEKENSEQIKQIRDLLNKTIQDSKKLLENNKLNLDETVTKVKTNFANAYTEFDKLIPKQIKDTINSSLEELKKLIPKK